MNPRRRRRLEAVGQEAAEVIGYTADLDDLLRQNAERDGRLARQAAEAEAEARQRRHEEREAKAQRLTFYQRHGRRPSNAEIAELKADGEAHRQFDAL